MNHAAISTRLEKALVARDLRGMAQMHPRLKPGYLLRAAQWIQSAGPKIVIATGFPVEDTVETDGPAGSMALYNILEDLGKSPIIAAEAALLERLPQRFNTCLLTLKQAPHLPDADLVVAVERPGHAADGHYYNMRGENLTDRVSPIDQTPCAFGCPVIAIGDGGNEWGMGKLGDALETLPITPSISHCDELIVADVSNWGCYGIIAMLQCLTGQALIERIQPTDRLQQLSTRGVIDGVTRCASVSEDGLTADAGIALLQTLQSLIDDGSVDRL